MYLRSSAGLEVEGGAVILPPGGSQNVSIVGVPASRDAGRAISRDYFPAALRVTHQVLPPTIPTSALIFQASLPVVVDVCDDALRDTNAAASGASIVTSSATVPLSYTSVEGLSPS